MAPGDAWDPEIAKEGHATELREHRLVCALMTETGIAPAAQLYHFDNFVLDISRGTLFANGNERTLRPKSFSLLCHLVENAGVIVSRDDIMQAIWPGVFVTEDSITQCIKEIRRALNDEAQALLRTVPRRGYRLAVSVSRPEPGSNAPEPASEPSVVLQPPPTGRPMIVVTPFEIIGGDPEHGYFADGLSNDLVVDLTRFQELHVVGLTHHRPQPRDPITLPPILEPAAQYVFGGSVRRVSGRIRVTVQLQDGRTGVNLWAERFDRPLDELFEMQEDLSNRIAASVVSHVGREGLRRALRHPPANLGAYDLYLHGRDLHGQATEPGTLLARGMFERAIRLDPNYAPAQAWLAATVQRGLTHHWGDPRGPPAALKALEIARRSVEIEPGSALCLGRLAYILTLNRRWDEALERGRAAVLANPCDASTRFCYGFVLSNAGFPAEAEAELRLAITLNPLYPPGWRAALGRALFIRGQVDEALTELRFCYDRAPDHFACLRTLAAAAAEAGQIDAARAAVRRLSQNFPGLTARSATEGLYMRNPDVLERFHTGFRIGGLAEG